MDMEKIIMEMIGVSGDARSKALEAIHAARSKEFSAAKKLLQECEEGLNKAHKAQTDLIVKEINGEYTEIRLLMVHAQDHMMNALTIKDIAEQFVAILEEMEEKECRSYKRK